MHLTVTCVTPKKKLTCPLKNDGWKTIFLLEWLPFSGYIDIYIYVFLFFLGGNPSEYQVKLDHYH